MSMGRAAGGGGGEWTRLVVRYTGQRLGFIFPCPWVDMIPKKGVNRRWRGDEAEGPQIGEGQLQSRYICVAHPFLRNDRSRSLMMMRMRVGEGFKPFAQSTTSPHKQAPRVGGLIEGVWAERESLVVGGGVGGRVREATDLGQGHLGHCVRN